MAKIFFATGDTSGEQHVGALAAALKVLAPDCQLAALGSEVARRAGVATPLDSSKIKVMGFAAIVKHLPTIYRVFQQTLAYLEKERPDALVLVDYPGFNLRLAKAAKKRLPAMKVVYYITPQVWAWHQSRVKIMARYVDYALCILPFEAPWLQARGVKSAYVGSPVADAARQANPTRAREILNLRGDERLVAVFPGSRRKELEYILPPFNQAVCQLQKLFPETRFVYAAAPGQDLNAAGGTPPGALVYRGKGVDLLAASYLCLAKSGTTTLEAALCGCPLIAAYKGDWLSARLAMFLIWLNKIKYVALPNIIASEELIPELLQEKLTAKALVDWAKPLLTNSAERDRAAKTLRPLREAVGHVPAAERAAKTLRDFLAK